MLLLLSGIAPAPPRSAWESGGFCPAPGCRRKTFAEQVDSLTTRYTRKTPLLDGVLGRIAVALAGRAGSRLASGLAVPASRQVMLRLVMATPDPDSASPRVLGVDDFATRRGQHYGTLLIDCETGAPLDLNGGRDAQPLADWLAAHPGVEIIRDRASDQVRAFATMITGLTGENLPQWIDAARNAGLPGIASFAKGLEHDLSLVTPRLSAIRRGASAGCIYCSGHAATEPDVAAREMLDASLRPLEPYPGKAACKATVPAAPGAAVLGERRGRQGRFPGGTAAHIAWRH